MKCIHRLNAISHSSQDGLAFLYIITVPNFETVRFLEVLEVLKSPSLAAALVPVMVDLEAFDGISCGIDFKNHRVQTWLRLTQARMCKCASCV